MKKNKLIGILTICIASVTLLVMLTSKNWQSPEHREFKATALLSNSEQTKKGPELGIFGSWSFYTPAKSESIDKWNPQTGKVIFQVRSDGGDTNFLVAKKRARGKKDERWEFPGGRVDHHETTIQATLRELREEDPSQTLYYIFLNTLKQNNRSLAYKKLELANGEKHLIFMLCLQEEDLRPLLQLSQAKYPLSKEIYEFSLIPIEKLDMKKKKTRKLWTSKSVKILKSLRASA